MSNPSRKTYQIIKSIASSSLITKLRIRDKVKYCVLIARENHYKGLNEEQKRQELIRWYFKQTGEELNLDSLANFNQKIQWLKLYDNTREKELLSDKYLVREWIKSKIGKRYLIPIYGVWDNANKIDFDTLPSCFVLKANHGSGMNYFVRDKSKVDVHRLVKMMNRWLRTPYDSSSMEQQYFAIPRRIIAEKYIEQDNGDLLDYKIHCFGGEPKFIQVIGDRDLIHRTAKEVYLDLDWQRNKYMYNTYDQYKTVPEKPVCLEEMVNVARKLSRNFIYVRVDLYVINEGVKFGEMTFTPAAGIGKWGGQIPTEWWDNDL